MVDVVSFRPAPFFARSEELERLRSLTSAAAGGSSAAVLVAGDAGVGKTSLVVEAARRAASAGALVMVGRCVDFGADALPYLPFAEVLSQLVRAVGSDQQAEPEPAVRAAGILRRTVAERPALARIAGGHERSPADRAPGDTGLDRLALFEAVAHLLRRIGDDVAPLLLVIEDLHWADASSCDLIRFLLARLGEDRLLVVLTYREDDLHRRHPVRPLLGKLARLPHVHRLHLAPFAQEEMAAFLTGVHGADLPSETIRRIAERSAGNAYYAEELLAAGATDVLPAGLADVLLDRLERLSPAGQHVVRVASVLGSARIDDVLLRACLATEGGGDAEAGLREATAHRLLVPYGPDQYAFRHALLQEAVYGDLLPGERVRLHAVAARQLAATDATDGAAGTAGGDMIAMKLARHALAAHDLPLALRASLRAASGSARRSAPAEALSHYEQVLQLWDVVEPDRRPPAADPVRIHIAAAAAAGDAGLLHRALALAGAAVAAAESGPDAGPRSVAPARVSLALHTWGVDDPLGARDLARRVVADLDGCGPDPVRVLARSIEARVDVTLSQPEAALEVLPEALEEAEALDLPALTADLLTSLAIAYGMAGRPGTRERWAQARAAAERAGDAAVMMRVLYNTAIDLIDAGDLVAAVEVLEEALAVADRSGLASSIYGAQSRSNLMELYWQIGDPVSALRLSERTGQLTSTLNRQLKLFALPVLAAREPERVATSGDLLADDDLAWHGQVVATARAEAFGWLGRPDEAVAAARTALDHVDADPEPYRLVGISISTTAVGVLADVAVRARARGDEGGASAAVAAAAPFVEDARTRARLGRPRRFTMGPEGLAWLARLDAEIARLEGTDAEKDWAGVAQAFGRISRLEVARARWRRAQALSRDGHRDRAREEAAGARADATAIGARPLVEAIDDLAREAGLAVAVTPDPGAALLTRRERDVMRLVAGGLTNRAIGERLFISEKTASVHVSNVLAKLGASGRTEAVAIIARHGLLDR